MIVRINLIIIADRIVKAERLRDCNEKHGEECAMACAGLVMKSPN